MSPEAPSLRVGDLVEIRPAAEILATLDADGSVENVPFMPEMLPFVGKRFRVAQRAEKICDLVGPGGSRRTPGESRDTPRCGDTSRRTARRGRPSAGRTRG